MKWEHDVPVPPIPKTNFASLMLDILLQHGDNIALVDAMTGKSYTYNELHNRVLRLHAGLTAAGVGLGEAVMLLSINHIDIPVVNLAVILSGAMCVPVNPALTTEELIHVARVSEAKWVVTNNRVVGKVEKAFGSLGPDNLKQIWIIGDESGTRTSIDDLIKSGHLKSPYVTSEGFDSTKTVALMPFSSGTTGLPKGVLLSHQGFLVNYMLYVYLQSLYPDMVYNIYESLLLILPMFHIYGFNTTNVVLANGGKIVILPRFSPEIYFQTIEKYKVTFAPVVPHIIKYLAGSPIMEKYDLSSILVFVAASAPLSESTIEALMEKSGKLAMQAYGMTETCAGVSTNGGPPGSKPDSVGRVFPYFQAKVINTENGEMLCEGEEGELCVRGPAIMLGYANNPEATAEAIDSEGWLHTGDLCYYDEDNFLYITDRIKDLIKVKGYQVSPTEIENVLLELEEVSDVAVAGVPNDRFGEAPRAWVVPAEGATIDSKALIKHVADRMVSYKQLTGGVEVVKILPKNHMGKVLRRQLKKSYAASSQSKL